MGFGAWSWWWWWKKFQSVCKWAMDKEKKEKERRFVNGDQEKKTNKNVFRWGENGERQERKKKHSK